jgi:ribosomal protein S16
MVSTNNTKKKKVQFSLDDEVIDAVKVLTLRSGANVSDTVNEIVKDNEEVKRIIKAFKAEDEAVKKSDGVFAVPSSKSRLRR